MKFFNLFKKILGKTQSKKEIEEETRRFLDTYKIGDRYDYLGVSLTITERYRRSGISGTWVFSVIFSYVNKNGDLCQFKCHVDSRLPEKLFHKVEDSNKITEVAEEKEIVEAPIASLKFNYIDKGGVKQEFICNLEGLFSKELFHKVANEVGNEKEMAEIGLRQPLPY